MSDTINSRNEWIFSSIKPITDDKDAMLKSAVMHMLARAVKMFKYNNLPDTIKAKDLETQLLVNGFAVWKEVNGELYTFFAGLGGEPNPYYLPTKAVIANPALRYNKTLDIDTECVVMLNDYYYQGLMPMFNKYANLLVEAEITIKYALWNARIPAMVQADNETTLASAERFFRKIIDGKEYGVISSKEFFDGIKSHDFYKETHITDIIEAIQYIKGSWYNEIGLNAAFNMKREAINEAEATLNEDILVPTIDVMLECRQNALERVNKMYNTNITVELDSIWKNNRERDELTADKLEAEIDEIKDDKGDYVNEKVDDKGDDVNETI